MFVAIGAGYPVVALLHFALHALMKAPLFMVAGIAGHQAGSYNLANIARVRLPDSLIYTSAIAALALAGLFPLGAAWTKEGVVSAAGVVAPWLAIVVMLAGGLSAVYAARFQWSLFLRHKEKQPGNSSTSGPAWQQHGPLYVLAVLVLSGSVLWLPTVNRELGAWLASSFPGIRLWEFVVSMVLVLLGLFAGYRMVTTELGQGERRLSAGRDFLARWLFLPQLAQRFVVMPVDALSRRLATLDDKAVDAVVRAGARFALWLASVGVRSGESLSDLLPRGGARFGLALAATSSRCLEWLSDQLPEAPSRLSGLAGHQIRRLQSGMLHHYYSLMAAGVGVFVLTLLFAIIKGGLL